MWGCQVGSHRLLRVLISLEGVGWEHGDEHTPCASSAGFGEPLENFLQPSHKDLKTYCITMPVDCVTKAKYHIFGYIVTMIYSDSY